MPSTAGAPAAPAIVSSSGRKRRPAASARPTSVSCMPAHSGSGSQSGNSIQGPTSCSCRNSSETHVTSAPASSVPQATPSFVALNVPERPCSTPSRIQSARSRTSTNCASRSGAPGARISPPRATSVRPVGEAAGGIVRPNDQTRPDDQRALSEHALDLRLRERLQGAVVGGVGRELVERQVAEVGRRARLGRAGREVGVDGDARDEDVAAGVAQLLRRRTHVRRDVAGRVDDCVPRPPGEQREVALPVAVHLLDLREEVGVRLAAVEERQLVPAGERRLGRRPAEELRPAEDQDPQWNLCTARQTASAPNSSASTGIRSSAAWISFANWKSAGSRIGRKP